MINFLAVIYIIDIQWFSIIINMLYSIFLWVKYSNYYG